MALYQDDTTKNTDILNSAFGRVWQAIQESKTHKKALALHLNVNMSAFFDLRHSFYDKLKLYKLWLYKP
jgi:hypothetical protein